MHNGSLTRSTAFGRGLRSAVWTTAFAMALLGAPTRVGAQAPALPAGGGLTRGSITADDAMLLASGWTLFAQGNTAGAERIANDVLGRSPRSVAAIALAVEASIAGAGSAAGLGRYEQWLGTRADEPGLLRTIARALLVEVAGQPRNPRARSLAVTALARIGETAVIEDAREAAHKGSVGETAVLAASGDPGAVQILIAELGVGRANKLDVIEALAGSGQQAAVTALAAVAANPAEPGVVRDAAVDALGALGQPSAIPHLKAALGGADVHRRTKAAAALLKLGDETGVPVLRQLARSQYPNQRLAAARGLAARPDGAWMALVRPLLAETDPEIRLEAATLLLPHDPAAARAVLEPMAASENPTLRDMAVLALVEDLPASLGELRAWLKSADRIVRVRAAARLLELTD